MKRGIKRQVFERSLKIDFSDMGVQTKSFSLFFFLSPRFTSIFLFLFFSFFSLWFSWWIRWIHFQKKLRLKVHHENWKKNKKKRKKKRKKEKKKRRKKKIEVKWGERKEKSFCLSPHVEKLILYDFVKAYLLILLFTN